MAEEKKGKKQKVEIFLTMQPIKTHRQLMVKSNQYIRTARNWCVEDLLQRGALMAVDHVTRGVKIYDVPEIPVPTPRTANTNLKVTVLGDEDNEHAMPVFAAPPPEGMEVEILN